MLGTDGSGTKTVITVTTTVVRGHHSETQTTRGVEQFNWIRGSKGSRRFGVVESVVVDIHSYSLRYITFKWRRPRDEIPELRTLWNLLSELERPEVKEYTHFLHCSSRRESPGVNFRSLQHTHFVNLLINRVTSTINSQLIKIILWHTKKKHAIKTESVLSSVPGTTLEE